MKTLLLYPPITDPTSGYHSLTYIETYARQQGFHDIDLVDTNIEALLYSMTPEQMARIKTHISTRLAELERKESLDANEQLELFNLWKSSGFRYDLLQQAVEVMKDESAFYDYEQYRPAAELLISWLDVLSVFGYPGQFNGYNIPVRYMFNLSSSSDMANHEVTAKIAAPYAPYFEDVLLPMIQEQNYKTVGINVTYCAQLPFALAISRMIRARFPEIVILFGGTEVSDVWKYLIQKERFFNIFDVADACVIGEGEVAFTRLLEQIESGEPFQATPNVMFHEKYGISTIEPEIEFGKIFDLPTPDYSKLPLEKYLSPHNYVYYSPSRGCYWNKCTFCDYGLNFDSPTSPWRQNPLDKILEDIQEITKHDIKHIYFSVDVLAPAMLLNLAEKIVENNIEVRWGAEIRLEKYWSPERCALLKSSGCHDISVGYESGNQRVLDLIDKGTQIPRIKETIHNFYHANIGVQMMGFTGFPTETFEEGMDSVRFLEENRQYWTFGGLGSFTLTPGSMVAKNPEKFQITNVKPYENEDICRDMYFENPTVHISEEEAETLLQAKDALSKTQFTRPWVGGVDSAHTMFYHERYGTTVTDVITSSGKTIDADQMWFLNGSIAADLPGYVVHELLQNNRIKHLHAESNKAVIGLSSTQMQEKLANRVIHRNQEFAARRYFIRIDGVVFPFPEEMIELLESFVEGRSLSELLALAPEEEREDYQLLLEHCVQHNFVRVRKSIRVEETKELILHE